MLPIATTDELGERTLADGVCNQMRGPLSVPGRLRLTEERLYFQPDRFNRLFGFKPTAISLDEIDALAITGIDRMLKIKVGTDTYKFHGKWARTIYERLMRTLKATTLETRAIRRERILFQTPVDFYPSGFLAVVGTLTVTTREVRYEPRDLERLVYRTDPITIPVAELKAVALEGPRKLIITAGSDLRFSSADATKLYCALAALAEHDFNDEYGPDFSFDMWPALHRGTVLSGNGFLSVTNYGVRFVAKGTLGLKDGTPEVLEWPFDGLDSLRSDRARKQLTITSNGQTHLLTHEGSGDRGEQIVRKFAASDRGSLPFYVMEADVSIGEGAHNAFAIIEQWAGRLPVVEEQTLLLFGPATLISPKPGTRRGWCALLEERLLWLPRGGPESGISPLNLDLSAVYPDDRHPPAAYERDIYFYFRGRTARLFATEGSVFTRPFWAIVDTQRAALASEDDEEEVQEEQTKYPGERRETFRTSLAFRQRRPALITSGESQAEGEMINISLDGCCVYLHSEIELRSMIEIVITDLDETKQTLRGQIVHCRKDKQQDVWVCGVKFKGNAEQEQAVRTLWTRCQRENAQNNAPARQGSVHDNFTKVEEIKNLADDEEAASDNEPADETVQDT